VSTRAAAAAAVVSTLDPYLIWHDVHVNREIVDQLAAAALVLLTLVAVERRSVRWAAAAGIAAGLAVLGNSRLALLPLVLAAYVVWRLGRRGLLGAAALVVAAGVAVAPWVVRNRVEVGCFALTTDARALWKANNPQTYGLLASGRWIDDVRDLPAGRRPFPNPEEERDLYRATGRKVHADECDAMTFYQRRVWHFWRDEPGDKAKLMGQAVRMEWDPRPTRTVGRPGKGTGLDTARDWAEPAYASLLFALGLAGLALVPRRFTVLALALLAYQTLAAMVFVGATRYRVPWDFLVAVLAGATLAWALDRVPLARRLAAE
jgi:hypothetical protein